MNQSYSPFFSIELLHEYFSSQKCNDLEIVPADDCRKLSQKMNVHWRNAESRLIALIKENDTHEPFGNTPERRVYRKYYDKSVFRFYLKIKNPVFLNYTNIELSSGMRKRLYFSNLAKNKESGKCYLSVPIADLSPGRPYVPGDLVRDPASGNVYEAIKKHSSKKKGQLADPLLWAQKGLLHLPKAVEDHSIGKTYVPGDLARKAATDNVFETTRKHTAASEAELDDSSLWLSRGQGVLQYPTGNDVVEYTNGRYTFTVPAPVTKADISISGFNYDVENPAYNLPVLPAESRAFEKPTTAVNVNLSSLKPGKYEIKVNKETKTVYNDPLGADGSILGIIEIFNHLPGSDDYALLSDDENIKYAKYYIQFPNRRVLWKYIRRDGKAASITDTGDTGYTFNLEGDDFVSTTPIPLSENVCKTLKLDFNTKDFRMFPLPNPQIYRLAKYTQHDYDYLCSEVYLNY